MYSTLKKLNDAKTLFQQSKEATEPEIVRANLSGCVEFLRSVTYVMQKEFAHVSGFDEWYSIKQEEMSRDPMFKQFNDLRVDSTKLKSIMNEVEKSFKVKLQPGERKIVAVIKNIDGKIVVKPSNTNESVVKNKYFFNEIEMDAIKLTSRYLGKIEKLVDECITKFNKS